MSTSCRATPGRGASRSSPSTGVVTIVMLQPVRVLPSLLTKSVGAADCIDCDCDCDCAGSYELRGLEHEDKAQRGVELDGQDVDDDERSALADTVGEDVDDVLS